MFTISLMVLLDLALGARSSRKWRFCFTRKPCQLFFVVKALCISPLSVAINQSITCVTKFTEYVKYFICNPNESTSIFSSWYLESEGSKISRCFFVAAFSSPGVNPSELRGLLIDVLERLVIVWMRKALKCIKKRTWNQAWNLKNHLAVIYWPKVLALLLLWG